MKGKFVLKLIPYMALLIVIVATAIIARKIDKLTTENERLKSNQEILITNNNALEAECRKYKVSDSLNAYKVSELRLMLDEYKKYRSEDLELIRKLKVDKANMQKVIDSQTSTIYELEAELKDTVIVNDNADSTAIKTFSYNSKWVDVSGQINLSINEVSLDIHTREAIMVVESVEYRRFLGFLWKTKKVKSRDVDVLSKNPNTEIIDVDYVSIEN